MIEIKNLHKAFGSNKVLLGIDVCFDKPGIYAILGPNSSGKTTLMKSMLGMVKYQHGTIKIHNNNVENAWNYRRNIGYLPQIAHFPENLKVKELFTLLKDIRKQPNKPDELFDLFDLHPFFNKKLGNLSGGTRQKVNIVQAFMYDSPILMLDEPTAGLDPVSVITLKNLIKKEKEKGKIILVTTHIMSFVEQIADQIVFLLEGKVHFNGSMDSLINNLFVENLESAIAKLLQPSNGPKLASV